MGGGVAVGKSQCLGSTVQETLALDWKVCLPFQKEALQEVTKVQGGRGVGGGTRSYRLWSKIRYQDRQKSQWE